MTEMFADNQPLAPDKPRPIAERQNEDDVMEVLCASTWHYKKAKRWHLVRVAGTLGFALAAPVITFWWQEAASWVATLAALWVLAGRTFLSKAEDSEMLAGVTAQEQFDVELFGLPWHDTLAGRQLAREDILEASNHIRGDERSRKKNWYANSDKAPWPLNVVLCQRSSAVWSRRSHQRYAQILAIAAGCWFVAGIAMGIAAHVSLSGYLIMLFLPSQPAFLDAMELIRSHRAAAEQRGRIEAQSDKLWELGLSNRALVTVVECRVLQDLSYQQRRHYPQVAEWYYRYRRARDEDIMKRSVERMLSQL